MSEKEKAREQAGQEKLHAVDSTQSVIRQRVRLSAQVFCTFTGSVEPPRFNVEWHGTASPSELRGLAAARYRRARDRFAKRLALQAPRGLVVIDPEAGEVMLLGLASSGPGGRV